MSLKTKILFNTHHLSHASSAYYPSPFSSAAILCVDGVGEWETTSTWVGLGNEITPVGKINFPHSLGLLYSAFTFYCGFKVNSGEYKLMGLAPYGQPKYVDLILDKLIHIQDDGSYKLNMNYFCYPVKNYMIDKKFERLFGQPRRLPQQEMTSFYQDMAASVQKVLELALVRMAKSLQISSGQENLCLAGGVALNCVANSKILKKSGFKNVWVQPAAGDAGGALGAALYVWHGHLGHEKACEDQMQHCYLGPSFHQKQIEQTLDQLGAVYQKFDQDKLVSHVVSQLEQGKTVGWFQGRMEYGPRALGARSILADPRSPHMQKNLNLKIKFRESFRPFAPITLQENQNDNFAMTNHSPYMMFTSQVKNKSIPAVTHVDGSARLQTLTSQANPVLHQLLSAFHQKTGCPTLINTSFNVRGEPIVQSPSDAFHCFMNTHLDLLVIDNFYLAKTEQPPNLKLPAMHFEKD